MAFHEIIGHGRIIRFLRTSVIEGTIAHAYLFFGPEGVGKKLVAFGLAKALNCHQQKGDYCDSCDSCSRIGRGVHPDLFFIKPEGQSLKIDQLRDLQESIRYKPFMAQQKVCIIDQSDRMTPSAANSILKTLEEPPGNMVFILVTANIDLILPTIRSRCQLVQFSPLTAGDLRSLIVEKMAFPEDRAHLLASFATGSLGRAQDLDLASLLEKREKILYLNENLGTMNSEHIFLEAKKLAKEKNLEDLLHLLDLWIYWYYDIWKYHITKSEGNLVNVDKVEYIRQQSQVWSRQEIEKNIQLLQDAYSALQRNANKQLALEVMLMKLSTNNVGYKGL